MISFIIIRHQLSDTFVIYKLVYTVPKTQVSIDIGAKFSKRGTIIWEIIQ